MTHENLTPKQLFEQQLAQARERLLDHIRSAHPDLNHPSKGIVATTCHTCIKLKTAIAQCEYAIANYE